MSSRRKAKKVSKDNTSSSDTDTDPPSLEGSNGSGSANRHSDNNNSSSESSEEKSKRKVKGKKTSSHPKSREKQKTRRLTTEEARLFAGSFDYLYDVKTERGQTLQRLFNRELESRLTDFEIDISDEDDDQVKEKIEKLAKDIIHKLNEKTDNKELVSLSADELDDIVSIFDSYYENRVDRKTKKLLLPRPQIPYAITEVVANDQVAFLRSILEKITITKGTGEEFVPALKTALYERYTYAKVPEGLQVGALAALYLSERTTQETLSTHKAPGMALSRVTVDGFEMANKLYTGKNPGEPQCYVHYTEPMNWETMELRRHELVEVTLKDIILSKEPEIFKTEDKNTVDGWEGIKWHTDFDRLYQSERQRKIKQPDTILRLRIDINHAFIEKLTLQYIGHKLEQLTDQIRCLNTPFKYGIIDIYIDYGRTSEGTEVQRARKIFETLMLEGHLAGIPNIKNALPAYTPYRRFILDKSWQSKTDDTNTKKKKKAVKIYLNEVLMSTEGCTLDLMQGYIQSRIDTLNVDGVKIYQSTEQHPADPEENINIIIVKGLDMKVVKEAVEYDALESFESLSDIEESDKSIIISPSTNISSFNITPGQFLIVATRTFCYMSNGDKIPHKVELTRLKITPKSQEHWDHIHIKLYGKNKDGEILIPSRKKRNPKTTHSDVKDEKVLDKAYLDLSIFLKYYNVWLFETTGSNLKAILALPGVNPVSTVCNVPSEILEVYGIDAANMMLFEHLNQVVNASKGIDTSHLELIVDRMTAGGSILSVDRYGVAKQDSGPLTNIATEEAAKGIRDATLHGRSDTTVSTITGVLAGIVLGIGTEMQNANIETVMLPQQERKPVYTKDKGRGGGGKIQRDNAPPKTRKSKTTTSKTRRGDDTDSSSEESIAAAADMDAILRRARASRKKHE